MMPNPIQHPASVDAYIRHGWSLVPIPPGTKGPRSTQWNTHDNALKSHTDLPPGYGIGLAHAYSGTMALDIDDWATAATVLLPHQIDLQALYNASDAVIVDSGRPGHGKLLYNMPFGLTLTSKQISINKQAIYNLRCATANGLTVQDVLPPSIHPDTGQPYRWAGLGNWEELPPIPMPLLDHWRALLTKDQERTINTGGQVDASWEEIRDALDHISADCSRDDWINIGMALHWAGNQTDQESQALVLWDDWSSQSEIKYPGEHDVLTQWSSFRIDKGTMIKLGTLFHLAQDNGWERPVMDVTSLFSAIPAMTPVDILEGFRPVPPEMDLDLWPSVLSVRAQEISDSVGCDPLVPLFAGLGAICGVVDAEIRLELMPGFRVPPVLWLMTIGDPADKKSPGSLPMLKPIKNIEAEDRPRFRKEMLEWEGHEAMYSVAKKAFLDFSSSAEAMLGIDQAPLVPELPPQPVPLRITVQDITSQKLVRHAAERPRGLLCHLDEMASWARKMGDKMSGEDRSSWVVSYESERYEMDRVGAGSILCENLAVSICGNIQPKVFRASLENLSSDGLLQRFILAPLRPDQTRLGHPVPDFANSSGAWENTLRLVYALPVMDYRLSTEAHAAYRDFQRWYEDSKQDERLLNSPSEYMTAFGKLEGTAGRLILLFHLIESPFNPSVSVDVVNRVVQVIKSYVIPAFRYALGDIAGIDSFDHRIAEFVIQHCDKETVTLSDIKRSVRRQVDKENVWEAERMIIGSMLEMEHAGWVMRLDDRSREHSHHAQWAINPSLLQRFRDYRERVIVARQRLMDRIHEGAGPSVTKRPRRFTPGYDPETMD